MAVTVVDASAIAAVIFAEPAGAPLAAAVSGPIVAPTLIRYELASICATKLHRDPAVAQLTLARYGLISRLDLRTVEADWTQLPELARNWALSAYDAAYLQLALAHDAVLITLDSRLAAAWEKAAKSRRS